MNAVTEVQTQTELARAPRLPHSLEWLNGLNPVEGMRLDPDRVFKPAARAAVERHVARLEQWLAPADPSWILGRVHSMMLHWRLREQLTDVEQEKVAEDWLAVLEDLPAHAIEAAVTLYLKTGRFRPVPADIRSMAQQAIREQVRERYALQKALEPKAKGV